MALDYAMSEQIENLSDVIERTEKDAEDFFAKNYVTQGMAVLLSQGLRRLAGRSDQAVFELRQAMGGGKTHTHGRRWACLPATRDLAYAGRPRYRRRRALRAGYVVAVNGRVGFEEHFLWGEIAAQLGKAPQFARFWKDGAKAPSERDWIELIGDEPTLILLDELPPYFDYAVTRLVGGGNACPGHHLRPVQPALRRAQAETLLHRALEPLRQLRGGDQAAPAGDPQLRAGGQPPSPGDHPCRTREPGNLRDPPQAAVPSDCRTSPSSTRSPQPMRRLPLGSGEVEVDRQELPN